MVAMKDDSATLEAMADLLVAGKAEHATDAIRKLGLSSEADERRLLRKWAEGKGLLSSKARERKLEAEWAADVARAYEDGYAAGREDGAAIERAKSEMAAQGQMMQPEACTPPPKSSRWGRLFSWAG